MLMVGLSGSQVGSYWHDGYVIVEDLLPPWACKVLQDHALPRLSFDVCGGRVSGLQTTWYYGPPGGSGFNLHQDNHLVKAIKDGFASVWIAMQDVTEEMGALVGYPGSQSEDILPQEEVNLPNLAQDPNGTRYAVIPPEKYTSKILTMKQGSALFMHSHFIHGSGPNTTDRWRQALLMTYIRQGGDFRPGERAKREPVDVYT